MKKVLSVLSISFISVLILFVSCQVESSQARFDERLNRDISLENNFADDTVVVVLTKEASKDFKTYTPKDFPEVQCYQVNDSTKLTMEIIKKQLEAEKTGDWSELKLHVDNAMLVNVEDFKRILDIKLTEKGHENVLKAIELLRKREDILYAEPDYQMTINLHPNPRPTYYDSHQLERFNQISLPDAWDINTGSTQFGVAILDTGIDGTHPAMNYSSLSRDFSTGTTDGDVPPYGLEDPHGHGTHVAGIITGREAPDIIGVAWDTVIISLRVFDETGFGYLSYVRYAVDYLTSLGNVPVANYSGGGYSTVDIYAMKEAIRIYPGLFVCAAGNNNINTDSFRHYPSSFTSELGNLISVGALDINNAKSSFSNYGRTTVDLFAPGSYNDAYPAKGIISAYPTAKCINGTCIGTHVANGYHEMPGTSMAAPFVTGVAILIKWQYPFITAGSIKSNIVYNVDPLPGFNNLCVSGGKLNALRAID